MRRHPPPIEDRITTMLLVTLTVAGCTAWAAILINMFGRHWWPT
jgi:hypothetical protein